MSELQNKFEVYCDKCGTEIEITKTMGTRVIARERNGFPILEQYFICQNCKKHYTVHMSNQQMYLLEQERHWIQTQIRICQTIGNAEETARKLIEKNDNIKQQQKELEAELKEKYRKECESDEHRNSDFSDSVYHSGNSN